MQLSTHPQCHSECEFVVDSFDTAPDSQSFVLITKEISIPDLWHSRCSSDHKGQQYSGITDMRKTRKVLVLGREEWIYAVRLAMLRWQKNGFAGVKNFWELCALPEPVQPDVAVIHHSFHDNEFRGAAEYIRRRWPNALIFVIGEKALKLDDPLYDLRTKSDISAEELVWLVERQLSVREKRRRNAPARFMGIRG